MQTIYSVPDNFIIPLIFNQNIKPADLRVEPLSVTSIFSDTTNVVDGASFVFKMDNLSIYNKYFWEDFKKRYPYNPSIGIINQKQALPAKGGDLLYGPDEILFLSDNTDESLLKLCEKLKYLSQVKNVHNDLCHKLNKNFVIGKSPLMRELICRLPRYANSDSTILLTGETGTGKELFARAFHYLGHRSGKPFITIDCSSLPESLAENELFGHEEEAYTSARKKYQGLIEDANKGTIFFDEIEALSLNLQKKLLRFIQEREIKPVGSTRYKKIDVRIIAASNEDLLKLVKEGKFRKDLFHRLDVASMYLPAVRERKNDIPLLVDFFLKKQSKNKISIKDISLNLINTWSNYGWPGNVREIENCMQKWLLNREENDFLQQANQIITGGERNGADFIEPLKVFRAKILLKYEKNYLIKLLKLTGSNISEASKLAGIHRKNFSQLLKKYMINPQDHK